MYCTVLTHELYCTDTCTVLTHALYWHMYCTDTCTVLTHVLYWHMHCTDTCTVLTHVQYWHMYCTVLTHVPYWHMYRTDTCTVLTHVLYLQQHLVVAFSLFARIFGECSIIHSPPALSFWSGDSSNIYLFPKLLRQQQHFSKTTSIFCTNVTEENKPEY